MIATMDGGRTNKSRNTGIGTALATGQLVQRVRGEDPQVLEVSGSPINDNEGGERSWDKTDKW